jgi:hypothetical protein
MTDEEARSSQQKLRWFWAVATLEIAGAVDRLIVGRNQRRG